VPYGVGGPLACVSQTQRSSMCMMTLGGGGFGVRPSTHILIVAPRRRGLRNQPQRADPVTYSMKVPKSITLAHWG
jgi:hypothetical protein